VAAIVGLLAVEATHGRESTMEQGRDRSGGGAGRGGGARPGADRGGGPRPGADRVPPLPDTVTGRELDREAWADLAGLRAEVREVVARHLVMAGQLIDDDPAAAWEHAQVARRMAARIGSVREAAGLAAYRAGQYAQALAELRTARRITGSSEHLPVMADCERGLGRPERALALAATGAAAGLSSDARAELLIVMAGARLDLGQPEAAVALLDVGELESGVRLERVARLRAAYATALAAAGRAQEAAHWQHRAQGAGAAGVDVDQADEAQPREPADDAEIIDLLDDEVRLDDPPLPVDHRPVDHRPVDYRPVERRPVERHRGTGDDS
jgi:hypothetical protein